MNQLINTIEQVREYLPANVSFEFRNIKSDLGHAFRTQILKILTLPGYHQIIALQEEGNPEALELKKAAQAANVQLALLRYLPFGQVTISTNGITNQQTQTQKTIAKWQLETMLENVREMAAQSLENMLEILDLNREVFYVWANSAQAKRSQQLLIKNTTELEQYQSINNSRMVFSQLQPMLQQVQTLELPQILGKELLQAIKKNEKPETMQAYDFEDLINYAKGYLASKTLAESIHRKAINLTNDGVLQVASTSELSKKTAEESLLNKLQNQYLAAANGYKAQIERMLNYLADQPDYDTDETHRIYAL